MRKSNTNNVTRLSIIMALHRLYAGLMGYAIFCVIALNWDLSPVRSELAAASAGAIGAGAIFATLWFLRDQINVVARAAIEWLDQFPLWTLTVVCVVGGMAIRIVWVIAVPAIQTSDSAVYLNLARKLIASGEYEVNGLRAYWPPGLPLSLVPSLWLFGDRWWVPAINNVALFVATALATVALAKGHSAKIAKVSLVLVAFWPDLVLGIGGARKEYVTLFSLTLAILCYSRAVRADSTLRATVLAGLSGCVLAAGVLTQPSLILAWTAFAIFDGLVCRTFRGFVIRVCFLVLGLAVTISPWTVRNYLTLGAFVPVTNTSGHSLYTGNNERAWGGWVDIRADFVGLDEVDTNREAQRRALVWMKENPGRVAMLAARKHQILLGDDSGSAYGLKLAGQIGGLGYMILKAALLGLWTIFLCLSLYFLVRFLRERILTFPSETVLLQLLVFYIFVVHSFFESGSRHHTALLAAAFFSLASWASAVTRERDQAVPWEETKMRQPTITPETRSAGGRRFGSL